jgi:hypothetical protein
MSTKNSISELLPEVEKRLKRLSLDRLKVANDFLAYLEERENSLATQELLEISGFEEAFRQAKEEVEKKETVSLNSIKRNV